MQFLVEEDQFNATWWWKDGHNSVRSYPHATFLHHDLPIKLSNISVLTVKGSWSANVTPEKGSSKTRSLSSAKARFNVAVDMFLHADPELAQNETTSQYEIMVWIGSNENPKPLGYSNGVKLIQRTANHSL